MAETTKKINRARTGITVPSLVKYAAAASILAGSFSLLDLKTGRSDEITALEETVSPVNELEKIFLSRGLVDVASLDPEIHVRLKYSSEQNFVGSDLYGGLDRAYLQDEPARMLAKASARLRELYPDYRLLVADAARPHSVQQIMYGLVKNTPQQNYVAAPDRTSIHNYGAAVDLTIVDIHGKELDMGTPLDHFGPLSEPRRENEFLKAGLLTREQIRNRAILKEVMVYAGYIPLPIEWWHFSAFNRAGTLIRYDLIE